MNQARNRTAVNTLFMRIASNLYIKMAAPGWPFSNEKHSRLERETLNYLIVCFIQCTLFFQYVCFLLPISLRDICGTYVTRINSVS